MKRIKDKRNRHTDVALKKMIRTYPDPALTTKCGTYMNIEDAKEDIELLCSVLRVTPGGVGLAANQLGITKRLIAVRPKGFNIYVMVNPVITSESIEANVQKERCLSYPGVMKDVERANTITVSFTNRDGKRIKHWEFSGWFARIIQHEIQHLEGKCALA